MFFRNGRRMVHPKRIHYEQGVLNQAVLFESAENTRPETVYYVSNRLTKVLVYREPICTLCYVFRMLLGKL